MIKRAPRPDSGFLLIRNDVVRDARLSYRARGLLCAMLSFPDNWQFNRDWLAACSAGEGQRAVRTALRELEDIGYLVRERTRLNKGRFGWDHVVYDTPQDVSAGQPTGAKPPSGQPPNGSPPGGSAPSTEQLSRTTEEEDVQSSPDFVGRDLEIQNPSNGDCSPDEPPAAGDDNWRDTDRAIFAGLVGAKVRSNGTEWNEGVWDSDTFYQAYRTRKGKKLRWPGRYLQSMAEHGNELGVEDWLSSEGLEPVE